MIVDHLGYGLTGGAAVAALRIHDGLRKRGVDSRYWHAPGLDQPLASTQGSGFQGSGFQGSGFQGSGFQSGDRPSDERDESRRPLQWSRPFNRSSIGQLLLNLLRTASDLDVKVRHLRHRPEGFEYFSPGRLRYATPWPGQQLVGDVLVLHWIGKLVDYPSFFGSLPRDRPVVWVLHDMNPFTGGCHFSAGCDRFTGQCGNCPQIAASGARDITFQTLRMKRQLYESLNLHVVAPSHWLSTEARRSVPFANAASHRVIPYGLETDRFTPVERAEARRALNLSNDKRIVLFGAASSENRRKGFHCLLEAWSEMPREKVLGVMFGAGEPPSLGSARAEIRHLGFIDDLQKLRLVYSAADLFVLPSLEDNLPQTGMEAMSCGTAVVAFSAGGIPDYVRPGETGSLAPTGDSKALAREICRLLAEPDELRRMGVQAREMMTREFSQSIESARYLDFLGSVIGASEAATRAA